ncbi:MAG: hypothetical protein R3257_06510 [bacterium]|nr:hypothetical protein [bacterium]
MKTQRGMHMIFLRFNVLILVTLFIFSGLATSCGGEGTSNVNNNFDSIPNEPIVVADSVDPDDDQQVAMVEPGEGDQNGVIGEVEMVTPNRVLCIIIDPAAGDLADLEVCEKSRANESADSVNGICPEADQESRCASFNEGSGPDFCQVTGDSEYVILILNFTGDTVTVAYQVIDVTDLPTQSCADLNITEDTITADDM